MITITLTGEDAIAYIESKNTDKTEDIVVENPFTKASGCDIAKQVKLSEDIDNKVKTPKPSCKNKQWRQFEDAHLLASNERTIKDIAFGLKRTELSVASRVRKLGMNIKNGVIYNDMDI
jgi:hypothetical protein